MQSIVSCGVDVMRKCTCLIFLLIICALSLGCIGGVPRQEYIDFEEQGFTKMYATAYFMGHHTANGSAVHEGGCACSPEHLGDVAIVYTLDGNFLGYYECNDTGGTEGLKAGTVIDIFRCNYTRSKSLMRIVGRNGGKVWVKWIKGKG